MINREARLPIVSKIPRICSRELIDGKTSMPPTRATWSAWSDWMFFDFARGVWTGGEFYY